MAANSVNNYRFCLVAVLDTLTEHEKNFLMEKKAREKANTLYKIAITYENIFLAYVLNDILSLCSKICKMVQDDDYYLYNILDTIKNLIKSFEDAYLSKPHDISGIYYQEFNKLLQEVDQCNHGVFKYHDVALHPGEIKKIEHFLKLR